jgi:hypothetical protein
MYNHECDGHQVLAWGLPHWSHFKKQHFPILCLILMTISQSTFASRAIPSRSTGQIQDFANRAVDNSSLLECLQVAPPISLPASGCEQSLMVHTFAYSYEQPFVGESKLSLLCFAWSICCD